MPMAFKCAKAWTGDTISVEGFGFRLVVTSWRRGGAPLSPTSGVGFFVGFSTLQTALSSLLFLWLLVHLLNIARAIRLSAE